MAPNNLQTQEEKRLELEQKVKQLEAAKQALDEAKTSGNRVFVPAAVGPSGRQLAAQGSGAGKLFFKVHDSNALRSDISRELSKLRRQL